MFLIEKNELDILRIYLAKSKESTVHNLMVARKYFNETKEENNIHVLLKKIEKMSAEEFSECIETLSS